MNRKYIREFLDYLENERNYSTNTIISYETNILDKEIIDLFKELKKSFQIVVLSNTTNSNKIKNICNTLNIEYIKFACKPFFLGFYKIKRKYNVSYNVIKP